MLNSRKVVKIQVSKPKSLLCDGKKNNRMKLNTNKTIVFSQSLLSFIRENLT